MASATTPIFFKSSVSMSQITQIFTHPDIFTSKTSYPNLSIPKKTIKIQPFSCSVSKPSTPFLSLKRTKFSSLVPLVAQTSDWAQQSDELVVETEEDGEDEEGAKLYVGNLTYDVDNVGLAQLFDQGGNVEIAEVIYNRDTNQSRGFGFVTMSSVEDAEKAIDRFHGQRVNGRILTVNKAAPRGSQADRPPRITETVFRLYVGNLPWDVDSARLEEIFSEHGKVVEARLVIDRDTGRSRGFGFVAFSSESEMNDAITALDGETLNGRAIRVSVAEERPKRNFF